MAFRVGHMWEKARRLPSWVEHDVHEQGGHRGQCVWVQTCHAEHVTGTGERVNDGTWDWERGRQREINKRWMENAIRACIGYQRAKWGLDTHVNWCPCACKECLTEFRFDETVGDSRAVGGYRLSIDHPEEGELGGQRVHDHGEIPLSDLDAENQTQERCDLESPKRIDMILIVINCN